MTQITTRRQLLGDVIPLVYKRKMGSYGPHDLALLIVVLAVGCLLDLNLEAYNLEAQVSTVCNTGTGTAYAYLSIIIGWQKLHARCSLF
jgi:hypothetical protein